jgi:Flp pilus assembly protein TadG
MRIRIRSQIERKSSFPTHGPAVRTLRQRFRAETGGSLVELGFLLPVLSLLLLGTIDLGRFAYMSIEVSSAARAGVQYGQQSGTTSTNITAMQSAATNDAPDLVGAANGNLAATASYWCQRSDGTGVSASCAAPPSCSSNHRVHYVKVVTSASYKPWFAYPGIPSTTTLNGQAVMRSEP